MTRNARLVPLAHTVPDVDTQDTKDTQVRGLVRWAGPAVLGYTAVRLVGMVILLTVASARGLDGMHRLSGRWDSVWYQRIATHGYGHHTLLPGGVVHSDLAFFPLLPALERMLAHAVPALGAEGAGLAVSWTASLVAACGIFAVGARIHGRRTGILLAVLWGAYPTAYVQSMAYTETLFTAFAAWALYAVLTERWALAGVLCVCAGLTRPAAAALVTAVVIAGVWRLRQLRPGRQSPREPVPDGRLQDTRAVPAVRVRVVGALLLAPLGWFSYVVFVALREGSPLAYFTVQAGWNNRIDGGLALARFVGGQLRDNPAAGAGLCAAFAVLAWTVRLCLRQRPRQPLPLIVYTLAVVAVSLVGSGYFGSRPRLMMPAFPLLLPAAAALARVRHGAVRYAVVGAAALASGTYGALALLGSGPP